MKKAIPTDVYDGDGNMAKIDFHDGAGEFIVQVVWDPRDEQTSDKRVKFREWAYRMINQLGYEVLK
jgi:hypothetical protein